MAQREITIGLGLFSIDIRMQSDELFQRLASYYRDFLTDQEAIISIKTTVSSGEADIPTLPKVSPHTIEFNEPTYRGVVNWRTKEAYLSMQVKHPLIGIDYFLRVTSALVAYYLGGLMVHAAGVELDGKAYLFLGHSGAGKTTTARNSPDGSVLNDDLLVLYPKEGAWIVFATPFYNPTQVRPRPGSAPLAKTLYLVKDTSIYLESTPQAQALAEMIACVPILCAHPDYLREIMKRCQKILNTIPYYRLHLLPNDSYWEVLLER